MVRAANARRLTGGLFAEEAVLVRREAGYRADRGGWTPGTETRTDVRVTVAPAPEDAARLVADGDAVRVEGMVNLYCDFPVRVGADADVFEIDGTRYRAVRVSQWSGALSVVFAQREDPQ